MGCGKSRYVLEGPGAPRQSPEISEQQQSVERQRECRLSQRVDQNSLPPVIAKELSRRVSHNMGAEGLKAEDGTLQVPGEENHDEKKDSAIRASKPRISRMLHATNSQAEFARADQTIIIFDWDDTLCPSTSMRRHAQFDQHGRLRLRLDAETRSELDALQSTVIPLLRFAKAMGKVIIVTNAKTPWVDISCRSFLPGLRSALRDIPVIYALELVRDAGLEGFDSENGCLLTEVKARAMKTAVTNFYSRYPNQSWKNIVSIGDALFEHTAIRQVVSERPTAKRCRTKTIKLLEGPTTAGMVVQLSIISAWLAAIVQADEDVDIDLSADEKTLNEWVAQYGEVQ